MKIDSSENIRQKGINYLTRFLTILLVVIIIFKGFAPILFARQIYRVAIFDFDRREITPDPLNYHIETMLKERLKDIEVNHYSGQGDVSHSVKLLQAIDVKGYNLVITRTSDALIIAQHTLLNTPTLYTNVNNPLLLGFKTLGPPGGNISGVTYYIPIEKHLRIYKAIFPSLKKPGFIFDKHNKSSKVEVPETRDACAALGLKYEMEFVDSREHLRKAANTLIERGVDTIIAASSDTIYENIQTFLEDANRSGIPIFSFYKMGVSEGAVAALSSDYFRMADELLLPMATKVLEDKVSPGTMPVAFLEKNLLFVNRSQAKLFRIIIPFEFESKYDVIYVDKN
jgi:putative ABC transport system substrate-binding protein